MYILGLESSCDESAITLLRCNEQKVEVLWEKVASQIFLHEQYGGVVPELASRMHLQALPLLYDELWKAVPLRPEQLHGIAVTTGPGLLGCLLMGGHFARGLALSLGKPLQGVHHIEGHLLSAEIEQDELRFPFLALVVSGGHTEIVYVRGLGDYKVFARTTDDAAGEAFDKSAHLLGFSYPGGAALAARADVEQKSRFSLPTPKRKPGEMSFSGLKTAISLLVARQKQQYGGTLPDEIIGELCFIIQESICKTLLLRVRDALQEYPASELRVCGGVAANRRLRELLSASLDVPVRFPSMKYCTDNATMIAYVAWARSMFENRGAFLEEDFVAKPRFPVEMRSSGGARVKGIS